MNKNAELRNGVWSSPGGDKKTYSDGHTVISWRKGKKLLQIEGKEDNLIKAKLCSAICNVNFVSSGEGIRQGRRKIDNWGGQYSFIRVLHN